MRYRFRDFELDEDRFELRRAEQQLELQPKALKLLVYLLQQRERAPTRAELLDALWPGVTVGEASLSRAVRAVRRALGESAEEGGIIQTVRGRGYRIAVPVEALDSTRPPDRAAPGARDRPTQAVFVGRETELARLEDALEEAVAGRPGILMLVGDPGIGKTRVAEELVAHAVTRGARSLWGRCYEGEGAPAFWPWIQIIRAFAQDCDPPTLRELMGPAAPDIAALVPALGEQLTGLGSPQVASSEKARFRLFEGIAGFLRAASMKQPLVIILDDLHWADPASLLLLEFLAAELGQARLLVLGSFRDAELRHENPLGSTLAELARNHHSERISLRGLTESDVARFIAETASIQPVQSLIEAIYRETEGNPFFVREVVRLLASRGQLEPGAALPNGKLGIPHGVHEVIGHRVSRSSETCSLALRVASVLGRDFEPRVVGRLALLPEEALLEALDEALAARLIEAQRDSKGRYRFSHALVRETLYEELGAPRRTRLHRRAGELLEQLYGAREGPHLAEIAHHFFQALQAGADGRALAAAVRAGNWASSQLAYEEAANQYGHAVEALELEDTADEARLCELLLELGQLQVFAGDPDAVSQTGMRALSLARRLDAGELFARAALLMYTVGTSQPGIVDERAVAVLEEALERIGRADRPLRARLLVCLAMQLNYSGDHEHRRRLREEARGIAERQGDPSLLFDVITGSGQAQGSDSGAISTDGDFDQLLPLAEESVRLARRLGEPALFFALGLRGTCRLVSGDAPGMHADFDAVEELGPRLRTARSRRVPLELRALRAILIGRFDEAEGLAREAFQITRRYRSGFRQLVNGGQRLWLQLHRGTLRSSPALAAAAERAFPLLRALLARMYAAEDVREAATRQFERLAALDFKDLPRGLAGTNTLCLLSDVCVYLGDARRAALLFEQMRPYAHCHAVIGSPVALAYMGSFAMRLGMLATLLGRYDEAEGYFRSAIAWAENAEARPWLAHTRIEYGRMLLGRGDTESGLAQAQAALELAGEMGMQGVANDALQLERIGGLDRGSTSR
jgi:DNA-binding winged helix-turn-helix (wHTH) protein/tetratricopeptide (TPR) repeat protein